jgi:hypothetical protein
VRWKEFADLRGNDVRAHNFQGEFIVGLKTFSVDHGSIGVPESNDIFCFFG